MITEKKNTEVKNENRMIMLLFPAIKQENNVVYATNQFVSNIDNLNTDKYLFVCNSFNSEQYNAIISPDIRLKFAVNEYVPQIKKSGNEKNIDLVDVNELKKVAFLII